MSTHDRAHGVDRLSYHRRSELVIYAGDARIDQGEVEEEDSLTTKIIVQKVFY